MEFSKTRQHMLDKVKDAKQPALEFWIKTSAKQVDVKPMLSKPTQFRRLDFESSTRNIKLDLYQNHVHVGSECIYRIGPKNALLVGFHVSYVTIFNKKSIGGLVPLFRLNNSIYEGTPIGDFRRFGEKTPPSYQHGQRFDPSAYTADTETIIARPGYGIKSLQVQQGMFLEGFKITFAQLAEEGKLSENTYPSPIMGTMNESQPVQLGVTKTNQRSVSVRFPIMWNSNSLPHVVYRPLERLTRTAKANRKHEANLNLTRWCC